MRRCTEPSHTPIVANGLLVDKHVKLWKPILRRDVVARLVSTKWGWLATLRLHRTSFAYHFVDINQSIFLIGTAALRSKSELELLRRQIEFALQLDLVAGRCVRRLRRLNHKRPQARLFVPECIKRREERAYQQQHYEWPLIAINKFLHCEVH